VVGEGVVCTCALSLLGPLGGSTLCSGDIVQCLRKLPPPPVGLHRRDPSGGAQSLRGVCQKSVCSRGLGSAGGRVGVGGRRRNRNGRSARWEGPSAGLAVGEGIQVGL